MSAFKSDHQLVRDYVTAMDHLQYTQLPEDVVAILLTHSNLPTKHLDIRLNLHNTIQDIKEKFMTHIGTPPMYQHLQLKQNGAVICEMTDNNRMLGFYSPKSGMEIHIIDQDPFSLSRNGGLTDTSLIQKYKMSDDKYNERKGTMREFIQQQKAKDPNFKLGTKKNAATQESTEPKEIPGPESVAGISVGMRCEVAPGARRGVVRFVGEIEQLPSGGYWVGVQFDEPMGRNDGTVKGVRIFDCPPGFGALARGHNIQVGDFPERDIFGSDDEADKNCCDHETACEEDEI